MPSSRIKSLHHNLGFQDPMCGGKNVVYHRNHRSKKGKRLYKITKNRDILASLEQKMKKYDEFEEKRCKNLTY